MATLNPQELETSGQVGNPFNGPVATTQQGSTQLQTMQPGGLASTTQHGSTQLQAMQPTSTMGSLDQGMYNPTGDAASIVNSHLGTILGSNNALMRNAQTQGLEQAASRGLQHSTIATGAAQRAALDYAMPLVGHAQDTFNQREHRGWQTGERLGTQDWQTGERALDRTHEFGLQENRQAWQSGESAIERDWRSDEALRDRDWRSLESQLDREFTTEERNAVQAWQSGEAQLSRDQQILMANLQEEMNRAQRGWTAEQNQLDRDQQLTMAEVQNWLNNESFMRDFNAQLATMPINNTANLLNFISQQAITNPEIYTPDIVSGMSEFFTTNAMDVLSRYFPNYFQNQGGN